MTLKAKAIQYKKHTLLKNNTLICPKINSFLGGESILVSGEGTTKKGVVNNLLVNIKSNNYYIKGELDTDGNTYSYKLIIPINLILEESSLLISIVLNNEIIPIVNIELEKQEFHLKILISSTAKTGNTWLRELLGKVYNIPVVELSKKPEDLKKDFDSLGNSWVAHQHYNDPEELVSFLKDKNVVILTIKRHPGDVLVSLFHFIKWLPQDRLEKDAEKSVIKMRDDGDVMGENTFSYVKKDFVGDLELPIKWNLYATELVSYEKLLENPIEYLFDITNKILPATLESVTQAVAACDINSLKVSKVADPRHFRKGKKGEWKDTIPDFILSFIKSSPLYSDICKKLNYSFDNVDKTSLKGFDYTLINPFYKQTHFDNGVNVSQIISLIYFSTKSAIEFWSEPLLTESKTSFYSWLTSPIFFSGNNNLNYIITPLSYFIYKSRIDLQRAFPNIIHSAEKRRDFCQWILTQAPLEYDFDRKIVESIAHSMNSQAPANFSKERQNEALAFSSSKKSKEKTIFSFCEFLEGNTDSPEWPIEVFLEISNVCDLKCAMCTTFSGLSEERFLKLKESQRGFLDLNNKEDLRALEPILEHALLVHCFGYGEPTIHPNFQEILEHILEYEVLVDFFTNGMHLTEELCHLLVSKKVFKVVISFSGSNKEDYENVYLGGHFETVLEGILRLAKIKHLYNSPFPVIEINSIGFQHHVDNIFEFIDLMAGVGVNQIELKALVTYHDTPQLHGHPALMRPDIEGPVLEKAKQYALERHVHFTAEPFIASAGFNPPSANETIIPISEFKNIAKQIQPIKPAKGKKEGVIQGALGQDTQTLSTVFDIQPLAKGNEVYCMEPFSTFYLRKDGHVVPCCFSNNAFGSLLDISMGNVKEYSAEQIWAGAGYDLMRKNVLQQSYPLNICKECIKHNQYPKHHAFQHKVGAYVGWFKQAFQQDFNTELFNRVISIAAGNNKETFDKLSNDVNLNKINKHYSDISNNLVAEPDSSIIHSISHLAFLPAEYIKAPHSWVTHIPFAFHLIDLLKPRTLVELGVYVGNSYNAFCQAVKALGLNTLCYGIDTWKGDEHASFYDESVYTDLAAYQQKHYQNFSYLLRASFDEMLGSFDDKSIDLLHIDGLHTYEAVKHDFDSWLPKVSEQGVIIFHDIAVKRDDFGVWKLWEEVSKKYPSFSFEHGFGLGILAVGENVPEAFLSFIKAANANPYFYENLFSHLGELVLVRDNEKLLKEKLAISRPDYFAQLFVDTGAGFTEEQSIIKMLEKGDEYYLEFDISSYKNIQKLRFDPLNVATAIEIKQLVGIDTDERPHSNLSCYFESTRRLGASVFNFQTDDPKMVLDVEGLELKRLIIHLSYLKAGDALKSSNS